MPLREEYLCLIRGALAGRMRIYVVTKKCAGRGLYLSLRKNGSAVAAVTAGVT